MTGSEEPQVIEPPSAQQLLSLVVRFLNDEVGPSIDDEKLRFRIRVAANLLKIASREFDTSDLIVDRDGYLITEEIATSAGSLKALTESLLQGRRDILEPNTYSLLRGYVDSKLKVTSPSVAENQQKHGSARSHDEGD